MPYNKNSTTDLTMPIIAIGSLCVSIKGCNIAKKAQNVSQNALEVTKLHFFQLNRPYIVLTPQKFEDNNSYYKTSRTNTDLRIDLKYEVKNIGNVAAKDITTPEEAKFKSNALKEGVTTSFIMPPKLTLGPGDTYRMCIYVILEFTDLESTEETIANLNSDESSGVKIKLLVNYISELDSSLKYLTGVVHRIRKNSIEILKSEFVIEGEAEIN